MKINQNFDRMVPSYLFAEIAKRVEAFAAANPDKKLIRLGIGDVTLPLAPVVVEAMKRERKILPIKKHLKGIQIMRATLFYGKQSPVIIKAME